MPLRAAALQFPRAEPAVAVVLAGARSIAELDDNLAMLAWPIPAAFWMTLREHAIVAANAPASPDTRAAMNGHVDAHHHVWALRRGDYGWLTPDLEPIYRDFSLADLAPLRAGAGVAATVLVQAAPTVAESLYLLDLAARSEGVVQGVVGWVDLAAPDAIPTLSRLARNPLLKAVRPMLQDLSDPAWLLRTDVGQHAGGAAATGLALRSAGARGPVARAAADDRTPSGSRGGRSITPPSRTSPAGRGSHGPAHMRAVAANPRARCKWSGLLTQAGPGWTIDQLRPYTDHLLDCFGPQRLLWGSDWPVVNLAGTYQAWYAATVALTRDWAPDDKAALMGGAARRFYGL